MGNGYDILVGYHEKKKRLGIRRRKWEDNINVDFKDVCCECLDCIVLVQDRPQCRGGGF
jgi:hypothetical protein